MYDDEYRSESRGSQHVLARVEDGDSTIAAFFEGRDCVEASDFGRETVQFYPLGDGEGVLRHYHRGGLIGRVARDGYLGNRMRREFEVHLSYYREGGSVPELLGVSWRRMGLLFRGAIATRRISAETLLSFLEHQEPEEVRAMLKCAGEAARHMHDHGVWHADLQLKNILVSDGAVWLIDFDNARRVDELGTMARARNLLRLRRSFEKHGRPLDNFHTFLEGYGSIQIPRWLDWLYRLRGWHGRHKNSAMI